MKTIVLDPGHGGHDPGAVGPNGLRESDVVLDVCHRIRERLERSLRIHMTRGDDSFVTLSARREFTNVVDPDLFVSIHCNSGGGRGFEIFTTRGETAADAAATAIFRELEREFPDRPARADFSDGDHDKEAGFAVLRCKAPAVLVELEFIDTAEHWLRQDEARDRYSAAVAEGIAKHLRVAARSAPEPTPAPEPAPAPDNERLRTHLLAMRDHANQALKLI